MNNFKSIGYEIMSLSAVLRHKNDEIMLKNGLPELAGVGGRIIRFLSANRNRDIFQRDIEEAFMVRRSTVSSNLRLLEAKGYIERSSVADDARLKKITLTEKAVKAHEVIFEGTLKLQRLMAEDLSEDELETFFMVIRKIKNKLV